jgi:hypothetical protein
MTLLEEIRHKFPGGLTAVLGTGGSRTSYILEYNRHKNNPGKIDFDDYGEKMRDKFCLLVKNIVSLGGKNIIDAAPTYGLIATRTPQYVYSIIDLAKRIYLDEKMQEFYKENHIDPYFVGMEAFLNTPVDSPFNKYAQKLIHFMNEWSYHPDNNRLILEVGTIHIFSIWRALQSNTQEEQQQLEQEIESTFDLKTKFDILYQYFIKKIYGFHVPIPHFLLSSNAKGSCKCFLPLPMILSGGIKTRFFYMPYSPIAISYSALETIIRDLIAPKSQTSLEIDYSDKSNLSTLLENKYQEMLTLVNNPNVIIGLTK